MVSVKEVPANSFISMLTMNIRKNYQSIKPTTWSRYVKTGSGKILPPDDKDWWYTRAASLLRKIYLNQPIGVERLRAAYGGRASGKLAPEHHRDGSGGNLRKILQQLELAQLVEKSRKGRILTPRGHALLDRVAMEVSKELKIEPWYQQYKSSIAIEENKEGDS